MYASANKVDNIIATIDYNKKQIDGEIDDVLPLGDLSAKFEAFDWIVLEEKKGNDLHSISTVLKKAKELNQNINSLQFSNNSPNEISRETRDPNV